MALAAVELLGAGMAAVGAGLVMSGDFVRNEGVILAQKAADGIVHAGHDFVRWWMDDLTPIQRGPFIMAFTIIVVFTASFGIPMLVKWHMGGTLLIDRVPPPPKGIFVGDVPPAKFRKLECVNPATGVILGYVPAMTKEEVARRVARAREAQKIWVKTSFKERKQVLMQISRYVLQYQDEIGRICAEDTGKSELDAKFGEIGNTLEKIRWTLTEGEKVLQPEVRSSSPLLFYRHGEVQYHPLGVIGAIQPWNYPFHNFMNTVISGIFAGNAVVVKASEHAGWSSMYFCHVIQEILRQCGHPMELVEVITGDEEAGEGLVESKIDKLFFTGSTKIGKKVAEHAAKYLLPVELELGGKDPLVVCDECDISTALHMIMRGVFQNSGQNCLGIERILVQEENYEYVVSELKEQISQLRVGDYRNLAGLVDMGAMTMGQTALFKIQELVNDAVQNGADLVVGGSQLKFTPNGCFYKPTLLTNVKPDMRIAQEEVFGPVACVYKFSNDDECLRIINNCKLGLGATVFVNDRRRAKKYIDGIEAGVISVNEFGTHYMNQALPFGGTKDSGYGRFGGVEGLRACCLMKTVTMDKSRFLKPSLPRHVVYPILENSKSYVKELFYLIYSRTFFLKWEALRNIMIMHVYQAFEPTPRAIDKYLVECLEQELVLAEAERDDAVSQT